MYFPHLFHLYPSSILVLIRYKTWFSFNQHPITSLNHPSYHLFIYPLIHHPIHSILLFLRDLLLLASSPFYSTSGGNNIIEAFLLWLWLVRNYNEGQLGRVGMKLIRYRECMYAWAWVLKIHHHHIIYNARPRQQYYSIYIQRAADNKLNSLGRIMIMLPRNIPSCTPLLGFGGFGNLIVLFGSFRMRVCRYKTVRYSSCREIEIERRWWWVYIHDVCKYNEIFNEKPGCHQLQFDVLDWTKSIPQRHALGIIPTITHPQWILFDIIQRLTYSAFVMIVKYSLCLLLLMFFFLDTLRSVSKEGGRLTPSPAKSDAHGLGQNAFLFSAIWHPVAGSNLQSLTIDACSDDQWRIYWPLYYTTTADQVFNLTLS